MDYKRNEQGRVESDRAQKRKSIAACLKLNKTEHTSIKKKTAHTSLLLSACFWTHALFVRKRRDIGFVRLIVSVAYKSADAGLLWEKNTVS